MANCQTWAEPTWRRRHSLSVVASVSVAIARELGCASTRSASGGAGSRPAAGRAGRCRCHPTLPPGKARAMRVEHNYDRGGALAYLAAWDVHRGQVSGRCEDTTGTAPFSRLVGQVMTTEPYASADRVFSIVDNGSSHRGAASAERMASTWPTAYLIHLPAHASRLGQAEIYFSVVQRKALTPNDFTGLDQIRDRLAAFERSATTLSLGHLPGSSPAPTSGTCCAGSTCTTKPGRMLWRPDLHPRRTYGPDH